nr:hypothetical protein CFP56_55294 [Quercus suber]
MAALDIAGRLANTRSNLHRQKSQIRTGKQLYLMGMARTILQDEYGPWLVVTRKKQGNRNGKKGSGSDSPKATQNEEHVSSKKPMTNSGLGSRKENHLSPTMIKRVNLENHVLGASKPLNLAHDSATSTSIQVVPGPSGVSSKLAPSSSSETFNGKFTSSEAQWKVGESSGGQHHRNQSGSLEKCAAAITSVDLLRIQSKPSDIGGELMECSPILISVMGNR